MKFAVAFLVGCLLGGGVASCADEDGFFSPFAGAVGIAYDSARSLPQPRPDALAARPFFMDAHGTAMSWYSKLPWDVQQAVEQGLAVVDEDHRRFLVDLPRMRGAAGWLVDAHIQERYAPGDRVLSITIARIASADLPSELVNDIPAGIRPVHAEAVLSAPFSEKWHSADRMAFLADPDRVLIPDRWLDEQKTQIQRDSAIVFDVEAAERALRKNFTPDRGRQYACARWYLRFAKSHPGHEVPAALGVSAIFARASSRYRSDSFLHRLLGIVHGDAARAEAEGMALKSLAIAAQEPSATDCALALLFQRYEDDDIPGELVVRLMDGLVLEVADHPAAYGISHGELKARIQDAYLALATLPSQRLAELSGDLHRARLDDLLVSAVRILIGSGRKAEAAEIVDGGLVRYPDAILLRAERVVDLLAADRQADAGELVDQIVKCGRGPEAKAAALMVIVTGCRRMGLRERIASTRLIAFQVCPSYGPALLDGARDDIAAGHPERARPVLEGLAADKDSALAGDAGALLNATSHGDPPAAHP